MPEIDPAGSATPREVGVALIGYGTVGQGVAALLADHHDQWVATLGLDVRVRHVVVRDAEGEIRAWGSVHDRAGGRMLYVHIVERDLPRLVEAIKGVKGLDTSYADLKGRSNYACLHRIRAGVPDEQGALVDVPTGSMAE